MAPPEYIPYLRVAEFYSLIMVHWGGCITTSHSDRTIRLVWIHGILLHASLLKFLTHGIAMCDRAVCIQTVFHNMIIPLVTKETLDAFFRLLLIVSLGVTLFWCTNISRILMNIVSQKIFWLSLMIKRLLLCTTDHFPVFCSSVGSVTRWHLNTHSLIHVVDNHRPSINNSTSHSIQLHCITFTCNQNRYRTIKLSWRAIKKIVTVENP